MRGPLTLLALAIATALLASAALAGNGNGNSANAPGQQKKAQAPPPAQSSSAPGVKPSNTTKHWTTCTTGGGTGSSATCTSATSSNPDASKRYGNGKTAAQIANSRGAPAGTILTGPGNSQPHKVATCGKKANKSGGVDVHAVKSYSAGCKQQSLAPAQSSAAVQQSSAPAQSSAPVQQSGVQAAATAPAANTAPTQNVLGVTKTLNAKPAHGVLGKVSKVGTLPFTGFPLWATALAALALLAGGMLLRRQGVAQH